MNKKLEKIIETTKPIVNSTVILVGKTAEKMKDTIINDLPTTKVITINNEDEKRKVREEMKKKLLRNIVTLSIPTIIGGVASIVESIKLLDTKKKINSDIDSIDDDVDLPYKLEPNHHIISGASKDRSFERGFTITIKNNILRLIYDGIENMKFHADEIVDIEQLKTHLTEYLMLSNKAELIKHLLILGNIRDSLEVINIYNTAINNTSIGFRLKKLQDYIISDETIDHVKLAYSNNLCDRINGVIQHNLTLFELESIGFSPAPHYIIQRIIDYGDAMVILDKLDGHNIKPETQLRIVREIAIILK